MSRLDAGGASKFLLSMEAYSAKREHTQLVLAKAKIVGSGSQEVPGADPLRLMRVGEIAAPLRELRVELGWWQGLVQFLEAELADEEANFEQHPEEYFLPLEEVAYVVHWRKQLGLAKQFLEFLNSELLVMYGG